MTLQWIVWPPFKNSRARNPDQCGLVVLKWLGPVFLWIACYFTCAWFLHMTTFYYIKDMQRQEHLYVLNQTAEERYGYPYLSPGITPNETSFGALQDPIEAEAGYTKVDLKTIDRVSALMPVSWFFVTILSDDLHQWTKLLLCNSFLALGKGLFGFITVIPDSGGWAVCKARLGNAGMERMKREISSPSEGLPSVFWSTFLFEARHLAGEKLVRFCGDMMYSGHTYLTTLYGLGLMELTRMHTRTLREPMKSVVVTAVLFFTVGEQAIEIILVLRNRFHYTMDVVMALLLTFLFFTNGVITIAAKTWVGWTGNISTLLCCKPMQAKSKMEEIQSLPPEIKDWAKKNEDEYVVVRRSLVRSDGDVWIPICCVPFCCLFGRHHIVDDQTFNMMGANMVESQGYAFSRDYEALQAND
eukprot:gnl/MRDRNA2_/MRDRNA2_205021_c0_seq1.p1 gnl/MRDRNA2_/MRDRNA2_205021_c0~~gnl/MRDRNA2_/MRDRNA2_205021_c0_seq1.p1  ORF type:complete len:414 (-),score=43.08 gnl/MRDRNA2_/MRDRNA2_205021_c0_seq1:231-1472(-)